MKKIDLDFTALLDVLLILLFAFILNANAQKLKSEKAYQADLEAALLQNEELNESLSKLEAEKKELQADLESKLSQLADLQKQNGDYQKELQESLKKLSQLMKAPDLSGQSWHNYQVMANKFLVIEVAISSPDNQLLINQKKQPLYLRIEDALNPEHRRQKMNQIEDLIEKEIDQSAGSGNLILISAGKDIKIERLVYLLLWDSLRNLESKYGKDRLFKTEYYLLP